MKTKSRTIAQHAWKALIRQIRKSLLAVGTLSIWLAFWSGWKGAIIVRYAAATLKLKFTEFVFARLRSTFMKRQTGNVLGGLVQLRKSHAQLPFVSSSGAAN
ncbi:hypothetical protein GOP47_0005731 [Adiantum capillus-veneris]|uniref:Uncharacterized protein n=1 Tax=Adiantum capillus-veneris TaxID=13818 RepID=A0A9D4V4L5_ADICA|nr:hypothetical protein GOP47_0005160 [Adiantum capillus-veneris]KAI5080252.1 hypothetical protein GOP47_0005731 [Adiantum capillus-veneris]